MATQNPQLPKIELAKPGDLTVEIIEYGMRSTVRRAAIRVDKAKLVQYSTYFKNMFFGTWVEGRKDTVTLEEDNIKAMGVWFAYLHDKLSEISDDSVSTADIWHIISCGDKYDFDRKHLATWFVHWCDGKMKEERDTRNPYLLTRQLLFPCYSFNYAHGFQELTKVLVYEYSEHITEQNPTSLCHMHLPRRVIQQLNAARGRLRIVLHRELFYVISGILKNATCRCKEFTVFNYLRELQRIAVWPLVDSIHKPSIEKVSDRLLQFDSTRMSRGIRTSVTNTTSSGPNNNQAPLCHACNRDWKNIATTARSKTLNYFHGLCMDCMSVSKNVRLLRDDEKDYWAHNRERDSYDDDCRISHGEPTWYFSFMGRREKLGQFDQPADVQ